MATILPQSATNDEQFLGPLDWIFREKRDTWSTLGIPGRSLAVIDRVISCPRVEIDAYRGGSVVLHQPVTVSVAPGCCIVVFVGNPNCVGDRVSLFEQIRLYCNIAAQPLPIFRQTQEY